MTALLRRSKTRLLLTTLAGAAAGTMLGWLLRGDVSTADSSLAGRAASHSSAPPASPSAEKPARAAAAAKEPGEDPLLPLLRLLCAADIAGPRDMPRLLLAARATPGVVPFLAQHWAELDAPHMFKILRDETGSRPLSSDAAVREALLETWLAQDKEATLAALDDDNGLPEMAALRSTVVRKLLYSEPLRALEKITKWRLNLHYNDMRGIAEWAKRDPAAAADASAKVPLWGVKEHLLIEVAKVWKDTDPAAAMQWAMQHAMKHPDSRAAASMSHVVRLKWDGYDVSKANAFADTITDPAMRVKLGLPPLPRPASRTEPVLPAK